VGEVVIVGGVFAAAADAIASMTGREIPETQKTTSKLGRFQRLWLAVRWFLRLEHMMNESG